MMLSFTPMIIHRREAFQGKYREGKGTKQIVMSDSDFISF
jgi:hypothetical protein